MQVVITIKDKDTPEKSLQLQSRGGGKVRLESGGQTLTLDGAELREAVRQCLKGGEQ
ncbi:MAG: hypothetical protein LBK60_06310 [Verrucomicrobiales bacterium]|jgi:hypothetical protein|nr:hypothetical protein [Verrucomicrobiales bacterium]